MSAYRSNCEILTVSQMAQADALAISDLKARGRSGADLMEEAGLTVVREILKRIEGRNALILCGPGNNGGDGFVIARHLKEAGWDVEVGLLGDIPKLRGDAHHMATLWDGEIVPIESCNVSKADLIVDAIFGTGLAREISGKLKTVIESTNGSSAKVVAVDIPSGIKGDTGEILGAAVKADLTVTFCRKKPSHLLFPGKEYCGDTIVTDIGISDRVVDEVGADIFVNSPGYWNGSLPATTGDIHKYTKGHAVVVSGDQTHTGACRLAAMAALRVGAGLVSVSSPGDALETHAAHLTSIMIRHREQLSEDLKNDKLNCWCIGPAAGVSEETKQDVLAILESGTAAVLDADALTVFEEAPLELFEAIKANVKRPCVLTPHAGEFGRIFPYLKKLDKITATRNAATLSGAVIIYKGADTVIAAPDGRTVICDNAPATLATAGSGDVLAGIVSGLLAQNMEIFEASCAAQWIHSECANIFGLGLISEDLPGLVPEVLKRLKSP